MLKIAVAGARGRMGGRIAALSREYEGIKLVGAFEQKGHPEVGKDMGTLMGVGSLGVPLYESIEKALENADMLIEFTSPAATLEHMEVCAAKGKSMVIGTTGLNKAQVEEVGRLAAKIPCVMASNMSLGVNLLFKVLADVARVLGDDYDVEITEAHHRFKKDAPSGTAIKIAEAIARGLDRNLDEVAVYSRKGIIGERTKKEIGIQAIRAGDIVGEHTVLFGGLGERIEITHRASSRDTFARGALRAALWLQDKKPGLYDMQDVLGLK
jgi:4-hydroxy-tetrahydrodipicolinate reductase